MNIVGIGTEIVECVRIGRAIERHGELFLTRVYTAREIHYCRGKKYVTEHFAGRWAAKEAILKCLAMGRRQGLCWTDIEVRTEARTGPREGAPKVYLCGPAKERTLALGISDILVTIAHCRAYATATAIAVAP
jgi:holo-[acyl-carrier protein] synthase